MSKNSNTEQRTHRQQTPTKIIVERHYVGTEKMETVFKRIAEEQITIKIINQLIEKILVSEPVEIDGRKFNDLLSITSS